MSSSPGPLKKLRLITLFPAWVLCGSSSGIGIHALIRLKDDKAAFKELVPAPIVVFINTRDIFGAGVAVTVALLLTSMVIFNRIIATYRPPTRDWGRNLRFQSFVLLLGCAFLFASMVPYMVFFVNRQASVKAFIGTTQQPDAAIKAVEDASGFTRTYKKVYSLKLLAIFPWISLASTLVPAAILYVAGGASTDETQALAAIPDSTTPHHEKAAV